MTFTHNIGSKSTHGKEHKDIALGLGCVDLENSRDRSVEVVCFGLRGIMDIDRVPSTWNCDTNCGKVEVEMGLDNANQ